MRKIILFALFSIVSYRGLSNTFTYLFAGAGVCTKYNYDMGLTFGASYSYSIGPGLGLGFTAFAQQYNLYYDKQDRGAVSGDRLRFKGNYLFICPRADFHLGKHGYNHLYFNAGLGLKAGATDTLTKWQGVSATSLIAYDSVIDKSSLINSMVMRIGIGATQLFNIRGGLKFTFTEDIGFLPSLLSKTDDPTNEGVHSIAKQFYRPTYITLSIGICYIK